MSLRPVFFPHSPFQELINGAKMALNCLVTFPFMAIYGGISCIYPHILAPPAGFEPTTV